MERNDNLGDLDLGKDFLSNLNHEVNLIWRISFQNWYCLITLKIEDFRITLKALIDSGAGQNYIKKRFNSYKIFWKNYRGTYWSK